MDWGSVWNGKMCQTEALSFCYPNAELRGKLSIFCLALWRWQFTKLTGVDIVYTVIFHQSSSGSYLATMTMTMIYCDILWFCDGSHTFLCSKDGSGVVYFLHPKRRHSKDQFCLKERLLDPEQGTQRYRLRKLFCRWFASNSPIFIRDSMIFSHKPWSRLQKLHGLQSPASSLKLARPRLVLATWCYWPYLGEWDQSWFVHHETLSKLSQTWSGLICLQFVCHALVFRVEELPVHTSIYIHITSPWDVFLLGSSPFCHHDSLQESQHLEPVTFMTNFNLHLF